MTMRTGKSDDLRLDLGCGNCRKEGTIGLDIQPGPGVDHVLDLANQPLPFADRTVAYVHSSHFLEHVKDPTQLFAEITRVAADGARLEFWTPYAWENSAFIIDHKMFFNEDHYLHICVWFVDFWEKILKARWQLEEFTYVLNPVVAVDLHRGRIPLDFALRYHKGVVKEFGVHITVRRDKPAVNTKPRRTFCVGRNEARYPLPERDYTLDLNPGRVALDRAIAWLSMPDASDR